MSFIIALHIFQSVALKIVRKQSFTINQIQMKQIKFISFALLAISIVSCSTSKISYSWKSDAKEPSSFNKIMVVAMNGEKDAALRQQMEHHMVGDLKALGYNAVSAMDEYGPRAFRDQSESAVIDNMKDHEIDAILTIVLLDKTKERKYVPTNIYYSPYSMYYRRFWGYYTTMYDRIYGPGYYTTDTRYFWESNLYDVNTKELLFTAQTQSFDPPSSESLAHEYGKLIVNDMVKKNVLNKK